MNSRSWSGWSCTGPPTSPPLTARRRPSCSPTRQYFNSPIASCSFGRRVRSVSFTEKASSLATARAGSPTSGITARGAYSSFTRRLDGGLNAWQSTLKLPSLAASTAGVQVRYSSGRCDRWTGSWEVTAPNHPDKRIWSVVFAGSPALPSPNLGSDLDQARHPLERALSSAISLVDARMHYEFWETVFRDARALLSSPAPRLTYYHELLIPHRSLIARQLLAAACRAWVFGGMGSWNDVGIADEPEYQVTTKALYASVPRRDIRGDQRTRRDRLAAI